MEKTGITISLVVLLLSTQPQANAAAKRMEVDGCTLLASTIESAVLSAAGRSSVRAIMPKRGDRLGFREIITKGPASCDDTTRITTAAFSAALFKIGMPVGWGHMPPDPGDYCYSHYLEQCYPRLVSGYMASSAKQLKFVSDAWNAVNIGVRSFMPYGTAGNLSSFSPGILKLSMIGAVASNVDAYNKPPMASPVRRQADR
jgi:hypothetical protein